MKTSLSNLSKIFLTLSISGLLALTGCEKETDVGGPGAARTGGGVSERDNANTEDTFVLTCPSGEVDITQGETQTIEIGIERGDDFKQNVKVSLMAPIEGMSLEPADATFSGDNYEMEVKLVAAADAPLGVTSVTLIGKPDSGESVNAGIKVKINEKE